MKKSIILFVAAAVVIVGAIVYINKQKATPPPVPVAETAPAPPEPKPQEVISTPKPETVTAFVSTNPTPAPAAVAATAVAENNSNDATNSIHKIVDALLTARKGKHEMFQQLSKDQLQAVIADLQQRALTNPQD